MKTAVRSLLIVLFCIAASSLLMGAVQFVPSRDPNGGFSSCDNAHPFFKVINNTIGCAVDPGAGTGAPTTSTYLLKTADGTLTNSFALSTLGTGVLRVTTGTGALSTYGGTTCTNQFARSLDANAQATCAAVQTTDLAFTPALQSSLDAHTGASTGVHGIANTANLLLKDGSVAMDKANINDTAGSPVANRQWQVKSGLIQSATTGGVEGQYISPGSLPAITLGTGTTGNYVRSIVAGTNVTLSGGCATPSGDCTINSSGSGGTSTPIYANVVSPSVALTLSGEQTIDGVTTSGSLVLAAAQGTASQNGLYTTATGSWTRAAPLNTGAGFAIGTTIQVLQGTANAGTTWTLTNTGAITLGTTSIGFTRTGNGALVELKANKNVAGGYTGSDATTNRVPMGQLGGYHTHAALAAANAITPTQTEEGVSGSGGAVTLTSNPPIVAGVSGQILILSGTDATNTVTINNGNGVRLCGNTGSVTVGLNGQKSIFQYNTTLTAWEQIGCPTLQAAYNVSPSIFGASAAGSAVQIGTDVNTNVRIYGSTVEGVCSGAACPNNQRIRTGQSFNLTYTDSDTACWTINDSGTWTFSNNCKLKKTIALGAAAFQTDGTNCTDPTPQTIVTGGPRVASITCIIPGTSGAALFADVIMPASWDAGTITVTTDWFSASNLTTQHVDTDWNGQCVRNGDVVAAHTTTGVQSSVATFGNQANDERLTTTAAITLNGTCAAGAHVYLRGRMLSTGNATMTNVRFLGAKVVYSQAAASD